MLLVRSDVGVSKAKAAADSPRPCALTPDYTLVQLLTLVDIILLGKGQVLIFEIEKQEIIHNKR